MVLAGLSDSTVVRSLGLYLLARIIYYLLYSTYDTIRTHFFPTDLTKFGEWAAVTGATDGIGKELSRNLARKGLNILLISRSEERLKLTAKEIENDFNVKTSWVQADFGGRDCYNNIEKAISDLDIGILVNNVGAVVEDVKPYTDFSIKELWSEMDINCSSTAIMTRLILPQMKTKNKGLIVFNASLVTEFGLPTTGTYAASKSFIRMFAMNLQQEVEKFNIKVCCLIPGFVNTKLLVKANLYFDNLRRKTNLNPAMFIPSARDFARYAVNSFTSDYTLITGYWAHTLMIDFFGWLPMQMKIKMVDKLTRFLSEAKKVN